MTRRSSHEVVKEIGETLTTEPRSVTEISEEIEARKQAVGRWLNTLHEAGLIEHCTSGNKKLYSKPGEVRLEISEQ